MGHHPLTAEAQDKDDSEQNPQRVIDHHGQASQRHHQEDHRPEPGGAEPVRSGAKPDHDCGRDQRARAVEPTPFAVAEAVVLANALATKLPALGDGPPRQLFLVVLFGFLGVINIVGLKVNFYFYLFYIKFK